MVDAVDTRCIYESNRTSASSVVLHCCLLALSHPVWQATAQGALHNHMERLIPKLPISVVLGAFDKAG